MSRKLITRSSAVEAAEVVGRRQELRVAVEQRVGQLDLLRRPGARSGQVPEAALVLPARTCAMSGKTRVGLPSAMLMPGAGLVSESSSLTTASSPKTRNSGP